MERTTTTNLPLKPRKLILLAVSSSLIFCFLFYYCLLNIAPLRTHFLFIPCNSTNANGVDFEEPNLVQGVNVAQGRFNSTVPAKDGVFDDDVHGNVSGEVLDLRNSEEEVKKNVSSLEAIESVKLSDGNNLGDSKDQKSDDSVIFEVNNEKMRDSEGNKIEREVELECDVYDGKWVFDESYPLYDGKSCSFIDEGFSCEANGRTDREYMKWRWKPHRCDIPRFDPVKFLESIRGKRLVFVGDSINRNQWESMMCILQQAVSDPKRIYEARRRRITKEKGQYNFKFVDYNCSVEYYVTHFLVHESKARIGTKRVKTLRIDTVDKGATKWRGADVLVFNTAHWWSHHKTKSGVNYYQEGDMVHPRLDVSSAFHKSLNTWAWWVDRYINPAKTKVFFRSSSPSHFSGGEWNTGGHCKEGKRPLNFTLTNQIPIPETNLIVQEIIDRMRTPVTVLNVTNLSGLRIDGHPSIYGRKPATGGQTSAVQDCSHWCLPGVPDTWNELLYYHVVSRQR